MTLPVGVTTCTVTFGKAVLASGREGTITGRVKLDRPIVHAATGTTLYAIDDELDTSVGGFITFAVPHVDQVGFKDAQGDDITEWAYRFTGQIDFGQNRIVNVSRDFQVRVGQDAVDLDLIPGGSITPGVTAPGASVLSIAGRTGTVTADDLLADLEDGLTATLVPKGLQVDKADGEWQIEFKDTTGNAGGVLHVDHAGRGGSGSYGIDIRNRDGAESALVIHQYAKAESLRIDCTDDQPSIHVKNTENLTFNPDGIGSGDPFYFDDHGTMRFRITGKGNTIIQTDTLDTHALEVVGPAATGSSNHRVAMFRHKHPGNGVEIQVSSTADGWYPLVVSGRNYGPRFTTSTDGGRTVEIAKTGTGTGEVVRIENRGTGSTIAVRDASAELFAVTAAGLPKWTAAANQQTTVGAAGAASALPATPSKYLKVVDSAGTTYVIPAYAAS